MTPDDQELRAMWDRTCTLCLEDLLADLEEWAGNVQTEQARAAVAELALYLVHERMTPKLLPEPPAGLWYTCGAQD